MIGQYFENNFAKIHYYKFGKGQQHMLCFHGFGMHGRQFKCMEQLLGDRYTFWGFDLFFHEKTELKNTSHEDIKKGIEKQQLALLIKDFCNQNQIHQFSIIGYSMGSHYATAITEEMPDRIKEYILAAPSSINPGALARYFVKHQIGNKVFEKIMLSKKSVTNVIRLCKWLKFIDQTGHDILYKEVGTPELRYALYASFTYLRKLETNEQNLINAINTHHIRTIFIFGKYDKMFLPGIGKSFFKKLEYPEVIILEADHNMINQNFVVKLAEKL